MPLPNVRLRELGTICCWRKFTEPRGNDRNLQEAKMRASDLGGSILISPLDHRIERLFYKPRVAGPTPSGCILQICISAKFGVIYFPHLDICIQKPAHAYAEQDGDASRKTSGLAIQKSVRLLFLRNLSLLRPMPYRCY